jgi:hypothetical protein
VITGAHKKKQKKTPKKKKKVNRLPGKHDCSSLLPARYERGRRARGGHGLGLVILFSESPTPGVSSTSGSWEKRPIAVEFVILLWVTLGHIATE